jgi:preprotein translocase subunit SecD
MPIYYVTNQFPSEDQGNYIFRISKDSLDKFQEILTRPEIAPLLPYNIEIAISAKPDKNIARQSDVEIYDVYGLKADPELTGEVVTDARASFDPTTNAPIVLMGMNTEGAERWARITGANIKKRIAIVLDGRVYSAPTVQDKISGGSSQITGMANVEEARLLEIVLKAGALKAPVQIIQERVVGPSLGQDSISSGLTASAFSFLLVILFMAVYYNKGGLVADFALLLNILLIISVLTAFGGTLTLPGIAGIILTIGMAVDANVLIFERIREELYKGRSLRSAVDEGFSKALSAIIDSNITTFITGIILFFLGSGPIQGFAMTIMIGIGGTLFTGILVSRAIIEIAIIRGATEFSFGQPKSVKA